MIKIYQKLKIFSLSLLLFLASGNVVGQVFITELADPNNDSGARFVELYNAGGASFDLAANNYALLRYTNGNTGPQSAVALTGTIPAGGFYVISNNGSQYTAVYGLTADQDIGTGGAADSNGDDQILLIDNTDNLNPITIDIFGVIGEDGSGTGHEFEDGRAERKASVTSGNTTWDVNEWDVDNDSGGGAGTQDAPADFDPDSWIGVPSCTTPSTQASAINFTSVGDNGITVNWTGGDGDDGVIVVAKESGAVDADPSSGTSYTANAAFGTGDEIGTGNYVVYVGGLAGADNVAVTGLTQGTTYHFAVYELNTTDVCYLTPGLSGSQATTSSVDADSDIADPAAQVAGGSISSVVNDAGSAVDVFTFKLNDAGTADGLATDVSTIVIEKGTNNTAADWSSVIAGAILNDGSSDLTVTSITVNTDNITFDLTGNEYGIADNTSKEITLSVYLNTSVTDGEVLEFEIPTTHGFDADANGSGFLTTLAGAVTSNQFTVDVTATTFDISADGSVLINSDFAVVANAVDANGNIDVVARTISLSLATGAGTLSSITGLSAQAMTAGVYTWSDVQYDAEEDITVTVDDDGSAITATSSTISIIGNLIFTDYFDYTDATSLNGQGSWNQFSGTADQMQVVAPGLSYTFYPNSGTGNTAKVVEGGSEDLAVDIVQINSGSVYVSVLVNVSGTNKPDTNGEYFLLGRQASGSFTTRVYVKDEGGILRFGITKTSGSVEYLTGDYNYDETNLLVFKYTFNTGTTTDDVMDFWVNPVIDGVEPTPTHTHSATLTDVSEIAQIGLRQSGGTGDILIDGLRVSTTWADLLPDFCTEPTTQASAVTFGATNDNDMIVNWTQGNGDMALVLVKEAGAVDDQPVSGTSYTANAAFTTGDQIGTGNYVVFNGTSSTQTVTVTGLSAGTNYNVAVFEYNSADDCYNTDTPALGNNTTTTPNDSDSDITANGGTTANIDYAAFQDAATLTTTNSASLFTFSINDKGTSDAASTTLTDVSFDITNHTNIRTLALFEGANANATVELDVATNIATNTLSFTGLSLAAASGVSNDITVRATFLSSVTDEAQIELTISSATADAGGSVFAAADGGGATSGASAIEVTATEFTIDAPTATLANTDFTVTATSTDANGNTDLAARDVTLSRNAGAGILSSVGGLGPVAMAAGVYSWTDVQHDTEETITLDVTDGAITTTTSNINVVSTTAGVFFSEYAEGSSSNKYVEIYNGTGASINLSNYAVKQSNNGAGFDNHATAPAAYTIALSGTLAAGDVYIIYNGSASLTEITTEGDLALSYGDNPGDRVASYNGDDAMGLFENDILIDLIGDPAVDPGSGWEVAGVTEGTANHTLVRKSSITEGNTSPLGSFGTDVANSEWTVLDQDDVTNIGIHTVDGVASPVLTIVESLTNFGSVDNAALSSVQTFTVEGADLTADVIVTAPSNFEVSSDGTNFSTSVTYTAGADFTLPTLASKTVSVRFAPTTGVNGVKSGDIIITTAGASNTTIAVSGTESGNVAPTSGVFITELADPNNDAGLRYIELYNSTNAAVDFTEGSGWRIDKYTNASATVSQTLALTGSIPSKGFYIIAAGAADADFEAAYGVAPDLFDGADNNVAGSNGDDNIELYNGADVLIDQFGVPGEDGTDTNHEFEDGRAERKASVTVGNPIWDVAEWNIDNDGATFPGNGTRDAPNDFDVAAWIGTGGPLISLDISTFSTDFGGIGNGAISPSDNFLVEGSGLTNDILITAPSNFMVSLDDATFTSDVTLTQSGGDVASTSVFVRFEPNAVQSFTGDITLTSTGATDKIISVSGNGISSTSLFYEGFATCPSATMVTFSSASNNDWDCTAEGNSGNAAYISGFGADVASDDWLITPAIDLSGATNATLTFYSWTRYTDTFYPPVKVMASTDYSGSGDPTGATWTDLSALFSGEDSQTWTSSGDIDLQTYVGGSVYIGFQYTSSGTGSNATANWSIDDILVEDRVGVANPSVTLTASLTDFGSVDNGSTSASQSFTVEGSDLTGDVTVTAPSNYEVSVDDATFSASITLTPTAGSLASTDVFVRFKPASGINGVVSGDITVSTTSALDQTIAVTGTEGGNQEITGDLFISEYIESTGNNKAIEIYNGTGASVDLSNYTLKQSHNGVGFGNDPVTDVYDLPLTGTLADGDVFIVFNAEADTVALTDEGDLGLTYADTGNGVRVPAFNGDDAIGLFKGGVLIDLIGDPANRPTGGWDVAGVTTATLDHILVRKSSITTGNITPLGSFGTTESNSEWIVQDAKDYSSTGSHTATAVEDGFALNTDGFNGDFVETAVGEVSDASFYTVSGKSITGDFTITIPVGFEASLTSDFSNKVGDNSTPLSITPANGEITDVKVYVRFKPAAAGAASGDLVNSAAGYPDVMVAVTGTATEDPTLGVEDIRAYDISIYPNPVRKTLSIDIPTSFGAGEVLLINSKGAVIKTGNTSTIKGFDVSNLRSGIYVLQIKNQQTVISHRVIIK